MKKSLLTMSICLLGLISNAQITVNVPIAGGFSAALVNAGGNANTSTNLIVTGKIDASDIQFMRDSMPMLAILDLESVQISAYIGSLGTNPLSSSYPANEMPEYSFYNPDTYNGKTSLTSIRLPNSILSIGNKAFLSCFGLTGSLIIPNSVTSIGDLAFCGCSGFTGSLSIPNSVTFIGRAAFELCTGIKGSLYIPNSITSIGESVFSECSGLTGNLTIPNSVTSIGIFAFYGCSGLTGNLTIPNSVTSIEGWAFSYCSGFTGNITIPNSVTSIGQSVFMGCNKIISTSVNEDNPNFSVIDGVLFNKAKNKLILFPAGKVADSYRIPNIVDSIDNNAFGGCKGLTGSLAIPNSVTSIASGAFYGCSGLTGNLIIPNSVTWMGDGVFELCSGFTGSLNIGNSVTYIGAGAFSGCIGLTGSLIISNSVTGIGNNAFSGCSGFSSLNISNSVNYISDDALSGCIGLQKIIVSKTLPPMVYESTFNLVNKLTCELLVPISSKAAYKAADYWKDFNNITEAIFVLYNSQGGSAIADTIVNYNTKIIAPDDPTRTGYPFAGWYKETECINAWNFATDVVTTNTTLYAKWESIPTYIKTRDAMNIKLFPNPAIDFVKIEGDKLNSVTIYNLLGIVQMLLNLKGEESATINVSDLKSGCYLILVKSSNGIINISKLIKK